MLGCAQKRQTDDPTLPKRRLDFATRKLAPPTDYPAILERSSLGLAGRQMLLFLVTFAPSKISSIFSVFYYGNSQTYGKVE